jgi:phage-related baseplate assembly protein
MPFSGFQFSETDARKIQDRLQRVYEEVRRAAGEPGYRLAPADPERLVQLTEAAVLAQAAADIDKTGKGNLLYFADESTIEHIGYLYGERGKRMTASYALTTLRYTLSTARQVITVIPRGFRSTPDNKVFFAVLRNLEIPPGQLYGDIEAQCLTPGVDGDGFAAGEIKNMVDLVPFVASVENLTASTGGAGEESLESYRERLRMLPESFSVAGPDGAYEFWARTANSGIADAKVWMPELDLQSFAEFLEPWGITDAAGFYNALGDYYRESGTGPGNVNVAVLMQDGGLPSEEILNQVKETLNGKTRRPLTDYVHVVEPETKEFGVAVRYWIETERAAEAASIIDAVEKAVDRYTAWQKSRLGLDVLPDILHKLIMDCGVKRLEITEPVFQVLKQNEAAQFNGGRTVTYEGFEDA